MTNDGLRKLPKLAGAAGVVDGTLANVLNQLGGLTSKLVYIPNTAAAVTASSAVATSTLSDAASATLQLDARLPGQHGNKIRFKTTRQTGGVFDLEVWFPDNAAAGQTLDATDATADQVRFTVASSAKYKNGDGPFLLESSSTQTGAASLVLYWLGKGVTPAAVSGVVAQSFTLYTTEAAAIAAAGASVNITAAGNGTQKLRPCKEELFLGVSMAKAHRRYVVDVVNTGRDGNSPSEYVVATNLATSTVSEPRPTDQGPLALGGTPGGEFTVTGLKRRDHIVRALNLTTPAVANADEILAVDVNTACVRTVGYAASANIEVLVMPR